MLTKNISNAEQKALCSVKFRLALCKHTVRTTNCTTVYCMVRKHRGALVTMLWCLTICPDKDRHTASQCSWANMQQSFQGRVGRNRHRCCCFQHDWLFCCCWCCLQMASVQYGEAAYWDRRYTSEVGLGKFEWYQSYATLKPILKAHLEPTGQLLHVS